MEIERDIYIRKSEKKNIPSNTSSVESFFDGTHVLYSMYVGILFAKIFNMHNIFF